MAYNNLFKLFQYQAKTEPVMMIPAPTPVGPGTGIVVPVHIEGPPPAYRRFQYQALALPIVVAAAAVVSSASWYQAWSEPIRAKGPIAALQKDLHPSSFVPPPSAAAVFVVTGNFDTVVRLKTFQYQSQAFVPVTAPPEVITEDKWHQPLSEPVRQKAGLSVQQQKDFFGAFPVTVPAPQINYGPLSEPVRQRPGLHASQQKEFFYGTQSPIIPSFGYYGALSEPVRQKPGISVQQQKEFFYGTYLPIIPLTAFYSPLSEPTRARTTPVQAASGAFQTPFVPVTVPTISYPPWSDPVRSRAAAFVGHIALAMPVLVPAAPAPQISYPPWSEPVRARPRTDAPASVIAPTQPAPVTPPVVIVTGNTDTVISRQTFQYQAQAFTPVVAPPSQVFYDSWGYPWSEPVRTRRTTDAPSIAFNPFPLPTVVPPLGYYSPLSEPVRQRLGLATQYHPPFFWGTEKPIIPTLSFYSPLSEPIRAGRAIDTPVAASPFPLPTIVTPFGWFSPLEGPRPSGFMSIDITSEFIALERVTEDRWHQPWSEPVRTNWLRTALQQSLAWPVFIPPIVPPEVITEDKWHQSWSEPVRFRQLSTSLQQTLGWPVFVPAPTPPVVALVTGNFDTVLYRQAFQYQAQAFTPVVAPPPPVFYGSWGYPWSEPVRQIRLLTASQQAVFLPSTTPVAPPVVIGVPVIWDGPPASYQRFQYQALAYGSPPIAPTIFYGSWGYPWSEPIIKVKTGLRTGANPFLFAPDRQPYPPYGWGYPWSEPVRQKPGLLASQQDWQEHKPILPPPIFYGSWGYPWSEPVRFKPGLRAWYHPYEFRAPAIYQFTYTARLYAVETDLDRFIGTLYAWYAPLHCYVDIIEFWPHLPYGNVTIIEKEQQSGVNTAIAEPVGQNPTGIISPKPAMGARVGIIVS
jgi:hypothetical protein